MPFLGLMRMRSRSGSKVEEFQRFELWSYLASSETEFHWIVLEILELLVNCMESSRLARIG